MRTKFLTCSLLIVLAYFAFSEINAVSAQVLSGLHLVKAISQPSNNLSAEMTTELITFAKSSHIQMAVPKVTPTAESKVFRIRQNGAQDGMVTSHELELQKALIHMHNVSDWIKLFRLASADDSTFDSMKSHKIHLSKMKARSDFEETLFEALTALRTNPKFALETAGLLEILAETSSEKRQIQDIAESEMMEVYTQEVPLPGEAIDESKLDASLSTDETMILPIVAHEVFLNSASTDQERFDGTLAAIRVQTNHNVRSALVETYVKSNPDRLGELVVQAHELGIDIIGYGDATLTDSN